MKTLKFEVARVAIGVIFLALTAGCFSLLVADPVETSRNLIDKMISAHGGMEKWRSAPTVSFEDQFLSAGETKPLVSQVTVEQGRRRAYIDFPELNARITWDGKNAWSENWKAPYPPRFLALLNYYFLNLPWLATDSGVTLGEPGKSKLWNDPAEYITVKMTFKPGTGDTPDDYYILYIDPKSHRLKACEYIVTYAALLPPGERATPHILVYEAYETVDGIIVPARYTIFDKSHSMIAKCEIRNWSFKKPFDTTRMTMPRDAVVDPSTPTRQK
jgi:hypothetical protein